MFVIIIFIIKLINSAQIGIDYFVIMTNQFSHCYNTWDFCSHKNPGLKLVYHFASRRFYM